MNRDPSKRLPVSCQPAQPPPGQLAERRGELSPLGNAGSCGQSTGCSRPSGVGVATLGASRDTAVRAATEECGDWSSGADKPNPRAAWVSGSSWVKGKTLDPVMGRGVGSIQRKLRSDHSVAVRVGLSRVRALTVNVLLGTSHGEGV